ncbi:MAG: LytTR family DNA-binding domain-containing protein [Bacteroidota bacterium]
MKVVIIEDEELAARRLESLIKECAPDTQVLAMLESVEEAVTWFRNHPSPDLIFLDIHLEDDLSFSIFEKVKVDSPIIFTTAFDEYAIRAFKMRSIDYLLKPIVQEELARSLEKYREFTSAHRQPDMESLFRMISTGSPAYKERFSITVGQKIKSYAISDIAWFYSEEGITFMVINDNHQYPLDFSLDELTVQLNPKEFFRINRQFLVKLSAIKNVHIYPKSRLKLELTPPSDKEVFVSRDKVARFKEWLG